MQLNQLYCFAAVITLALVVLQRSDYEIFWAILKLINSIICFAFGSNTDCFLCGVGCGRHVLSSTGVFTKSRQFVFTISKYNKYTTVPVDCGEYIEEISLMTIIFHQCRSVFSAVIFSDTVIISCLWFAPSPHYVPKHPSTRKTHPHSLLIRATQD